MSDSEFIQHLSNISMSKCGLSRFTICLQSLASEVLGYAASFCWIGTSLRTVVNIECDEGKIKVMPSHEMIGMMRGQESAKKVTFNMTDIRCAQESRI
jgi:hypothetical protein